MACHTWFNNKVSCITDKDIETIRNYLRKQIPNAYILKCSSEQWRENYRKELKEFYKTHKKPYNDMAKMELEMLLKMGTEEYHKSKCAEYMESLSILNNEDSTKEELLKVFDKHEITFSIKDDDYSLCHCGWQDQFRISDYSNQAFDNANDAIKFLENYDDGNGNIICGYEKGMNDKIREIIKQFFKKYPNGSIHYA